MSDDDGFVVVEQRSWSVGESEDFSEQEAKPAKKAPAKKKAAPKAAKGKGRPAKAKAKKSERDSSPKRKKSSKKKEKKQDKKKKSKSKKAKQTKPEKSESESPEPEKEVQVASPEVKAEPAPAHHPLKKRFLSTHTPQAEAEKPTAAEPEERQHVSAKKQRLLQQRSEEEEEEEDWIAVAKESPPPPEPEPPAPSPRPNVIQGDRDYLPAESFLQKTASRAKPKATSNRLLATMLAQKGLTSSHLESAAPQDELELEPSHLVPLEQRYARFSPAALPARRPSFPDRPPDRRLSDYPDRRPPPPDFSDRYPPHPQEDRAPRDLHIPPPQRDHLYQARERELFNQQQQSQYRPSATNDFDKLWNEDKPPPPQGLARPPGPPPRHVSFPPGEKRDSDSKPKPSKPIKNSESDRKNYKTKLAETVTRSCKKYYDQGKFKSKEDFKHVCRKLTHGLLDKREKDPKASWSWKSSTAKKVELYVEQYLQRHGQG